MSDLKAYIEKRMETDTQFADGFEVGYANFKIGVILRQSGKKAEITPETLAQQLNKLDS